MPAYHLVFHSYGSWLPDHPEGYVDRKTIERHPRNPNLGRSYKAAMKNDVIFFDATQQALLLKTCRESLHSYGLGIHAVAVVDSHIHMVVSWAKNETLPAVEKLIKQVLTHALNKHADRIAGQWFSRGAGDKKIRDRDHLVELVKHYFPNHGEHVWIQEDLKLKVR